MALINWFGTMRIFKPQQTGEKRTTEEEVKEAFEWNSDNANEEDIKNAEKARKQQEEDD